MIISHKYKFIFLKTYKTAGTSLEVFLSQHCGDGDVLTPVRPPVPPHRAQNCRGVWDVRPDLAEADALAPLHCIRRYLGTIKRLALGLKFLPHMPGRVLRRRIDPEVWNSYYKFCVERNPWDKTVSHFFMLKKRSNGQLTLGEYFDEGGFCINAPIYTEGDEVLVDRVLRYENLHDHLAEVFHDLGVPYNGHLNVHAKSSAREVRDYHDVLNDAQVEIIRQVFQREIEMHGYTYESSKVPSS